MTQMSLPSATVVAPSSRPSAQSIELRGVRVHNLKRVDLDIPLGKLVVLTGVSGSGKSSLAFDTIFAEGQRRYIESFSPTTRQYLERIERPNADRIAHVPPAIAIRTDAATRFSSDTTVASLAEIDIVLRRLFSRLGRVVCSDCGVEVQSQSAVDLVRATSRLAAGTRIQFCFTPNEDLPEVAAWRARGFTRVILDGQTRLLDSLERDADLRSAWIVMDRLVVGKASSERIAESAESALREGGGRSVLLTEQSDPASSDLSQARTIDERLWQVSSFSRHWECARCGREYLPPEPRLFEPGFNNGCPVCREQSSSTTSCPVCHGSRLCPEALAVRVGDFNLADVLRLTVDQAADFQTAVAGLPRLDQGQLVRDLGQRLDCVSDLGLGHLTLLRPSSTLTGGQMRRLLLANAQSSRITGTLCLVDEPSAGLHPSELPPVLAALRRLLERRNSVIVVDHSPQIILAADHVIDLGPGAGPQGGSVVFQGTPAELLTREESATAQALRRHATPASKKRTPRQPSGWLTLSGIIRRNLQDVTLKVPLGVLCVVSGPGGSGKTTLISDALVPALRQRLDSTSSASQVPEQLEGGESLVEVAVVDQTPLTRSTRSNAATWIDVFDEIRDVFAMSPEARQRGFGPQHFSFNATQGGRCRACRGTGILRHDMHFLPDVTLPCPECGGSRYRREILDVKYRGRSIADVLSMSAAEAAVFFRNHPRLQARLQMLKQIGLDYLVLGQPTDTLSGGEAQRLKLAARLTTGRGPTLIVCDEATVGLHPTDVSRLIGCFDELLGIGHSIVVIDNSPDLIAAADYLIEVGPVTGSNGSRILFEGPPH